MTNLHTEARDLEEQASRIREQLDLVYAKISKDEDEGGFLLRMAEQFRAERDQALRTVSELKVKLQSRDDENEAKGNAVQARFLECRAVIQSIVNQPLMPRDQVQSRLLLLNEKIRDF